MSVIVANNPHVSFPISPFGFIDDNFEPGTLNARWKTQTDVTPVPTGSIVDESSQKSYEIAHPAAQRYDLNQSGVVQGLFTYQDVNAGEDFELVGEVVYPDTTFSATNSMYLGVGLMFWYNSDNYTWLEAQVHPTTGARIRWGRADDTDGHTSGVDVAPGITIPVTPIYLKMELTGSVFEYFVSNDDSTYHSVGTLTATTLAANGTKMGIIAETYHATPASAVAWDAYCRSIKEIKSA